MIRKQKKRAARGKQTAFRRSGQEVDQKRIARFVRRYGTSWSSKRDKDAELQSPEPRSFSPDLITHHLSNATSYSNPVRHDLLHARTGRRSNSSDARLPTRRTVTNARDTEF